MSVEDRIKESGRKFSIAAPYVLNGETVSTEIYGDSNMLAKMLDVHAGIDAIWKRDKGIMGVASRMQTVKGKRPFDTFTIRYRTANGNDSEWSKRMAACSEGYLLPQVTIQGYIDENDKVVSVAAMREDDLMDFCIANPNLVHEKKNSEDGAVFRYCKWSDIEKAGFPICIYKDGMHYAYKTQGESMSINIFAVSGNLTRDAELRTTNNGYAILKGGIAVNERRKMQDGSWGDKPNYFDFTILGKRAEKVAQYLTKGRKVMLQGKLEYESWQAKDGTSRSKVSLLVDEVEFVGGQGAGNSGEQGAGNSGEQVAGTVQDTFDGAYVTEDIPF